MIIWIQRRIASDVSDHVDAVGYGEGMIVKYMDHSQVIVKYVHHSPS
jgi:hypothetical protein